MSFFRPYFLFAYLFWSLYFILSAFSKCLIVKCGTLRSSVYMEGCSEAFSIELSGWAVSYPSVTISRFLEIGFPRKVPSCSHCGGYKSRFPHHEAVWGGSLNNMWYVLLLNNFFPVWHPLFNSVQCSSILTCAVVPS